MSSNAAVILMRKLTGIKKIGHAGTLDPGACGVLPVCVGKATRISAYMMDAKKEYVAEVTFGKATDTGDSYGVVTAISYAEPPSGEDVARALKGFEGRIKQQTPAYSAVKIDGKRSYRLARQGAAPQLPQREVEIYDIEYLGPTTPGAHRLRVSCGKGTYIRTLCEDIGKALGQSAYMSFLARTKCAGLDIENSVTADELQNGNIADMLLPMDRFLSALPRADAAADQRDRLFHGGSVKTDAADMRPACIYAGGELLGIGSVNEGMVKINTRLVDA
jgi:tRNA pseudouridine 55 synthase